jgi:hypothetical protein
VRGDVEGHITMDETPLMLGEQKLSLPDIDVMRFRSRATVPDGAALLLAASAAEGAPVVLLVQPRILTGE